MLVSVKKAYDKNAFDNENPELRCPVQIETLETYMKILKPAYDFSIGIQANHLSIADVIPALLFMFNTWEKMNLTSVPKNFCNLLIKAFKQKFKFELESPIYKVSFIINKSKH